MAIATAPLVLTLSDLESPIKVVYFLNLMSHEGAELRDIFTIKMEVW